MSPKQVLHSLESIKFLGKHILNMSKHIAHLPQCASCACTTAIVPAFATCCVLCVSATQVYDKPYDKVISSSWVHTLVSFIPSKLHTCPLMTLLLFDKLLDEVWVVTSLNMYCAAVTLHSTQSWFTSKLIDFGGYRGKGQFADAVADAFVLDLLQRVSAMTEHTCNVAWSSLQCITYNLHDEAVSLN